jgi:inositol-phosphate transport system permease protein
LGAGTLPSGPSTRGLLWKKLTLGAFTFPAIVVIGIFFFAPVVLTFVIGFTGMDYTFQWNWVGLANYKRIFTDPLVFKVFKNTMIYVSFTLAFNVLMGLVLALVSSEVGGKFGTFIRALWLLPRITPSVVYAVLWTWFWSDPPYGLGTITLQAMGIHIRNLLSASPWAFVILLNGFVGASFGMIIFSSAIESIPRDYINAARVDGASKLQIIRYITLPLIKWHLAFVTAYQTLSLLTSFEYILLTTDGGPGFLRTEVWSLYAYHKAFQQYYLSVEYGFGAALAAVLVIIGLVASLIYWKIFRLGKEMLEPKVEVW